MPTTLPVRQPESSRLSEIWIYIPIALAAMLLSIQIATTSNNAHAACLIDQMGPLIPAEMADLCR